MLLDLLELTTVQVAREVETPNGQGAVTTTTTLTTLSFAAIWQAGSSNNFLSDRVTRDSTHILATLPSYYAWAQADRFVVYDGSTYKITGRPDDVAGKGEIMVVPLDLQT